MRWAASSTPTPSRGSGRRSSQARPTTSSPTKSGMRRRWTSAGSSTPSTTWPTPAGPSSTPTASARVGSRGSGRWPPCGASTNASKRCSRSPTERGSPPTRRPTGWRRAGSRRSTRFACSGWVTDRSGPDEDARSMTLDKFAALRDSEVTSEEYGAVPRLAEEPLSQSVYRRLRQDILSGVLRPNERLVETELGQLFEVSRTPVRDALLRLESDGLVDAGKRGWTVHEYDRDELIAIYETRAALEGAAARLAAMRATEEQLADIEAALRSERDDLLANSDSDLTSQENSQFHAMIYETCRNERLLSLIERNAQIYFNYRV